VILFFCSRLLTGYTKSNDVLDQDEEFERLEMERVMESDPESTAFYKAQKTMHQRMAKQKRRAEPRRAKN